MVPARLDLARTLTLPLVPAPLGLDQELRLSVGREAPRKLDAYEVKPSLQQIVFSYRWRPA